MQIEVTTSNEACTNALRLATEPLTFTRQWHCPDILNRCEEAEEASPLRKSCLQERIFRRAHAHSLTEITSDSFYYCNAAASHYNGINTVALLETEEYWIIRFKLAFYKKKKKEVTLVLQCIAKGKDLQKTSGLSAIYEMAVASKNFL